MCESLSHAWLFVNPWTLAHQASLSMEFSRQEYWNGSLFLSPGHLFNPGFESRSPKLQADSLSSEPPGKPQYNLTVSKTFSSVAQSCPTLCDPMSCSTTGLPVHHQLPKSTQTHVHLVLKNGFALCQHLIGLFPEKFARELKGQFDCQRLKTILFCVMEPYMESVMK